MNIQRFVLPIVFIGAAVLALLSPVASPRAVAQIKPYETGPDGRPIKVTPYGTDDYDGLLPPGVESRGDMIKRLAAYTPDPQKFPVPRTSWDQKPEFTGVYMMGPVITKAAASLESLYRPEVRSIREKLQDPDGLPAQQRCWPNSPARAGVGALPFQMASAPGVVLVIEQTNGYFRIIPTDGRPRNPSTRPSFLGDSVGRWEGDTLVVDVRNFNGKVWLEYAALPTISSTALHIVERWSRPDSQTLEYHAMVEDPQVLRAPWQGPRLRAARLRYDMIQEQYCVADENLDALRERERAGREYLKQEKQQAP